MELKIKAMKNIIKMNSQEFIYAGHFNWNPEELSENLSHELAQQLMETPEPEEIDFLKTQKGMNRLKFLHNNLDANQRHTGTRPKWGRPDCPPDPNEDDGIIFDSQPETRVNGENAFLCEGMTVVISEDGSIGVICINPNYKGQKKIHE